MSNEPVNVTLEFTPNPSTLKFVVNRTFCERGAANFTEEQKATHAPLAKKLFSVDGVKAVLVGTNFVTITKAPDGAWDTIAEKVPQTIEGFIQSGKAAFDEEWTWETASSNDSDVVTKIKQVLDQEIRPAVAMDGGDIAFSRYEDGIVYLQMQGACSSCPSSVATLKMGVETRLKEVIPEIQEVVQI